MWAKELVQFARLIAGLKADGVLDDERTVAALTTSTGMDQDHQEELIDQAVRLWDEVQLHANPAAWVEDVLESGDYEL